MHAIEIAVRLTLGPGDEALVPSPAWPNFVGAIETSGARAVPVRLGREGRWSLDPEKLAAAVTPATRVIFLNSPANPTGFVATREEIAATLAIARTARPLDRRRRDLRPPDLRRNPRAVVP